jgi:hypothetical protein
MILDLRNNALSEPLPELGLGRPELFSVAAKYQCRSLFLFLFFLFLPFAQSVGPLILLNRIPPVRAILTMPPRESTLCL